MAARFNPAPGWPPIPEGWTPPPGWTPDPNWPPAPAGWQFWVEDAPVAPPAPAPVPAPGPDATQQLPTDATAVYPATPPTPSSPQQGTDGAVPPSVPYAEYAHQHGGAQQLYPQGDNGQDPKKKNHLVWIIPVALLVVLGLVFAGLAIAGVFSSDDGEVTDASSTPAPTAPESVEPSQDPTEPSPDPTTDDFGEGPDDLGDLEGLDGLEGMEGLEGLEDLFSGTKSTDPAVPAFCESFMALEALGATGGEENYDAAAQAVEEITPPTEIAADWPALVDLFRGMAELSKTLDGTESAEDLDAYFGLGSDLYADEDAMMSVMKITGFIETNCDSF